MIEVEDESVSTAESEDSEFIGPAPDPPPLRTQSDATEEELVREALRKHRAGVTPTPRESGALKRFEKKREEDNFWRSVRHVPKKWYRTMSGRADKVLNEQANRFGAPIAGPEVDLVALIRWMHQFAADNRFELTSILHGGDRKKLSPKDRLEAVKAEREEMRLAQDMGKLVDREAVRSGLSKVAGRLRSAGQVLLDHHGEDARLVLEETLLDIEKMIDDGDIGV